MRYISPLCPFTAALCATVSPMTASTSLPRAAKTRGIPFVQRHLFISMRNFFRLLLPGAPKVDSLPPVSLRSTIWRYRAERHIRTPPRGLPMIAGCGRYPYRGIFKKKLPSEGAAPRPLPRAKLALCLCRSKPLRPFCAALFPFCVSRFSGSTSAKTAATGHNSVTTVQGSTAVRSAAAQLKLAAKTWCSSKSTVLSARSMPRRSTRASAGRLQKAPLRLQ